MLTNLLVWLFFGALAGWISSLIVSSDKKGLTKIYILVGMVGAVLGGLLVQLALGRDIEGLFINSFLVSVTLAVVLISLFSLRLNK